MLDRRSECLLKIINNECQEGSYKVLEKTELILALPKKYKADNEFIDCHMEYLSAGEYVSIKYFDNDVYCISPLPRGRRFFEAEAEEKQNRKRARKLFFWLLIMFVLFSFGTSMLANFIFAML